MRSVTIIKGYTTFENNPYGVDEMGPFSGSTEDQNYRYAQLSAWTDKHLKITIRNGSWKKTSIQNLAKKMGLVRFEAKFDTIG